MLMIGNTKLWPNPLCLRQMRARTLLSDEPLEFDLDSGGVLHFANPEDEGLLELLPVLYDIEVLGTKFPRLTGLREMWSRDVFSHQMVLDVSKDKVSYFGDSMYRDLLYPGSGDLDIVLPDGEGE